ncbi:BgTH12-07729 [Blumeria graminis f. sp. triticale]|uniref:BgTH12-07729 n=1 Tax=Blumeria graminis f. sp. triticale TaxID=1689686 RepID=A0A9W4DA01_BLUGR|nr:BgTH12-07729 [Blumeria graminis f. sp. triticale]
MVIWLATSWHQCIEVLPADKIDGNGDLLGKLRGYRWNRNNIRQKLGLPTHLEPHASFHLENEPENDASVGTTDPGTSSQPPRPPAVPTKAFFRSKKKSKSHSSADTTDPGTSRQPPRPLAKSKSHSSADTTDPGTSSQPPRPPAVPTKAFSRSKKGSKSNSSAGAREPGTSSRVSRPLVAPFMASRIQTQPFPVSPRPEQSRPYRSRRKLLDTSKNLEALHISSLYISALRRKAACRAQPDIIPFQVPPRHAPSNPGPSRSVTPVLPEVLPLSQIESESSSLHCT